MSETETNFFNIFSYSVFMHLDGNLTYEDVTILRNIHNRKGLVVLAKGDWFETVYFALSKARFEFINWKDSPTKPGHKIADMSMSVGVNGKEYPASVYIRQRDLAPFCHWEKNDRDYAGYRRAFGLSRMTKS